MTNCLNSGVHLTKNCSCANLVCLNEGVHLKALWLKCGCVLPSYPYLELLDDPVADDETYARLMAFHPDRVIHFREELQVF